MLGDGRVGEPDRAARAAQGAQLVRIEQLGNPGPARQLQVYGHPVTAAGHRDHRLGGQDLADRVEQRPEHGPGREARLLERQRLQGLHREQPGVTQFPQHVA